MTTFKQKIVHDYHDHSQFIGPSEICIKSQSGAGGVFAPFPIKLHVMLSKVEESGMSHIVSW
jgi:hypothetical protein